MPGKDETKVLTTESEDLGTTADLDIYAGRSSGFKTVDSNRAKIARIKAELEASEYEPDRDEIAKALIKKLKI